MNRKKRLNGPVLHRTGWKPEWLDWEKGFFFLKITLWCVEVSRTPELSMRMQQPNQLAKYVDFESKMNLLNPFWVNQNIFKKY